MLTKGGFATAAPPSATSEPRVARTAVREFAIRIRALLAHHTWSRTRTLAFPMCHFQGAPMPTRKPGARNILCVVPSYSPSFGTFENAYPLCGKRVRAFMPPQGILVIAAYLPKCWNVRFVDENIGPARASDF